MPIDPKKEIKKLSPVYVLELEQLLADIEDNFPIESEGRIPIRWKAYYFLSKLDDADNLGATHPREELVLYLQKVGVITAYEKIPEPNKTLREYGDPYKGFWITLDRERYYSFKKEIRAVTSADTNAVESSTKLARSKKTAPAFSRDIIAYQIRFTKGREILLNNFLLSTLNFDSENHVVFEYIFQHPNKEIPLAEIEKNLRGVTLSKPLPKIVENWGFTGQLKKVFFDVAKAKLRFRNPIYAKDLQELSVEHIRFPRKP